jgi:hypothetical protein
MAMNVAESFTACSFVSHLETPSTWALVISFAVFTEGSLSLGSQRGSTCLDLEGSVHSTQTLWTAGINEP